MICLTGDTISRINIVSRCFENKNNNCCETKFVKMPFVYYLQIHIWLLCGVDVLASGWPDHGFVNNQGCQTNRCSKCICTTTFLVSKSRTYPKFLTSRSRSLVLHHHFLVPIGALVNVQILVKSHRYFAIF